MQAANEVMVAAQDADGGLRRMWRGVRQSITCAHADATVNSEECSHARKHATAKAARVRPSRSWSTTTWSGDQSKKNFMLYAMRNASLMVGRPLSVCPHVVSLSSSSGGNAATWPSNLR